MKASRKSDERLRVEEMTAVDFGGCHSFLPCRLKASRCFGMRSASATSVGLRLLLDFADVRVCDREPEMQARQTSRHLCRSCARAQWLSARASATVLILCQGYLMPGVFDMTRHRGKVNGGTDRWASLALMSGQPGTGRRSLTPPQPVRRRRSQSSRRR